jgi:multiple sugar transport system ATP-binding protein
MDEPLTNLDFKLRVEMRSELKRIHNELNTTLFYVTNDQTEAMSLADRIAVLHQGVLQQVGTPEEIYDHPVNRFVASFVGSPRMNFLPCALHNDGEPALVGRGDAWRLSIPAALRDRIRTNSERETFALGVRPEDIVLTTQPVPGAITAEVYVVEPLGDRTIFDLRVGEDMLKVRTLPTFEAAAGSHIWLDIDRARIHLFDTHSDRAVL